MSASAASIGIQGRPAAPAMWRVGMAAAVVAAAVASGVVAGRVTAPSAPATAIAPRVQIQTGTITSMRPLSDASFEVSGSQVQARPVPRANTPATRHARQLAR